MNFQFKNVAIATSVLLSVASISLPVFAADAMLSTGGYAREMHKMEMMKMLDANGDHMVTKEEFDDYYGKIFDGLDTDHDGSIDAKEWAGPSKASKLDLTTGGYSRELRSMKMMKMMDADGDHKVTKDEFIGYHQKLFAAMDKKGDGQITAQEWAGKTLGGN
jgi:Ca2+-binding EF-hand superfamily protein